MNSEARPAMAFLDNACAKEKRLEVDDDFTGSTIERKKGTGVVGLRRKKERPSWARPTKGEDGPRVR